jgi:ribulose-5-phosphate 4-epimerase/fuculose-1-phosphate aldolase
MAAAHCHSMYGRTFSAMGKPIKMISQDATAFYNDVALHADGGGAVVLDPNDGALMAKSLGDKKALIHQNHGLVTTGGSVDAAIWWFVALDRCCQSQLIAEAAGQPIEVSDELARAGYEQQGFDLAGWFQFQPWWELLLETQPEFLD